MAQGYLPQALKQMLDPIAATYDGIAPETVRAPVIVMTMITGERWRSLAGPSDARRLTYQIDVYASSPTEREIISRSVREAIDGYYGIVTISGVSPVTTVDIMACVMQIERQEIEDRVEPKLFRQSMDFSVTVRETA